MSSATPQGHTVLFWHSICMPGNHGWLPLTPLTLNPPVLPVSSLTSCLSSGDGLGQATLWSIFPVPLFPKNMHGATVFKTSISFPRDGYRPSSHCQGLWVLTGKEGMPKACGFPQCSATLDTCHACSCASQRTRLFTSVPTPGSCPTDLSEAHWLTSYVWGERHEGALAWIPTAGVFSASSHRWEWEYEWGPGLLLMSRKVQCELKGKQFNLLTWCSILSHICNALISPLRAHIWKQWMQEQNRPRESEVQVCGVSKIMLVTKHDHLALLAMTHQHQPFHGHSCPEYCSDIQVVFPASVLARYYKRSNSFLVPIIPWQTAVVQRVHCHY